MQTTVVARVRWTGSLLVSEGWQCQGCGAGVQVDGPMTDEWRADFLAAEGRWTARVVHAGPHRIAVARRIRELFSVSASRALQLMRGEDILISGAQVEAELVQEALSEVGATTEIRQVEAPASPPLRAG